MAVGDEACPKGKEEKTRDEEEEKEEGGNVVFLVGPKGAGKSTIGRALASLHGFYFTPAEAIFLQMQQANQNHTGQLYLSQTVAASSISSVAVEKGGAREEGNRSEDGSNDDKKQGPAVSWVEQAYAAIIAAIFAGWREQRDEHNNKRNRQSRWAVCEGTGAAQPHFAQFVEKFVSDPRCRVFLVFVSAPAALCLSRIGSRDASQHMAADPTLIALVHERSMRVWEEQEEEQHQGQARQETATKDPAPAVLPRFLLHLRTDQLSTESCVAKIVAGIGME